MALIWRVGTAFVKDYWNGIWVYCLEHDTDVKFPPFVVRHADDNLYYLTPRHVCKPTDELGPFDTLEEAQIAAETVINLNAVPEGWK